MISRHLNKCAVAFLRFSRNKPVEGHHISSEQQGSPSVSLISAIDRKKSICIHNHIGCLLSAAKKDLASLFSARGIDKSAGAYMDRMSLDLNAPSSMRDACGVQRSSDLNHSFFRFERNDSFTSLQHSRWLDVHRTTACMKQNFPSVLHEMDGTALPNCKLL